MVNVIKIKILKTALNVYDVTRLDCSASKLVRIKSKHWIIVQYSFHPTVVSAHTIFLFFSFFFSFLLKGRGAKGVQNFIQIDHQ